MQQLGLLKNQTQSGSKIDELAGIDFYPRWARWFMKYLKGTPNHRGKRTLLRFIHSIGLRKNRLFIWKMQNGAQLAISPLEGVSFPGTVGWTCFEQGCWEPHIEYSLRHFLKPGSIALDVGANLGYFSAVMAQSVGAGGKVYAFEPVPVTFRQLSLCRLLNNFANLIPLQLALGADEGEIEIFYDPTVLGQASIYSDESKIKKHSVVVKITRLDALLEAEKIALPDLIKIDIEGHEYKAITGAQNLIRAAKPVIIFEFNSKAAGLAGWTLKDIVALLSSCGDYRFYLINKENFKLAAIDLETFDIADNAYVDIVAVNRPLDLNLAL